MTRAKQRLYITVSSGYSYVTKSELSESQFLSESGNLVKSYQERRNNNFSQERGSRYQYKDVMSSRGFSFDDEPHHQDFSQVTNDVSYWEIGDIVIHKKLGRGTVIAVEEDYIIKVDFDEHGVKTILGNHPMVSKGNK